MTESFQKKDRLEPITIGAGDLTWISNLESARQQRALHPNVVIKSGLAYKRLFLTARLDELVGSEWVKLGPVEDGETITKSSLLSRGLIFKPGSEVCEDLYIAMKGEIVHLRVPVVKKIERD